MGDMHDGVFRLESSFSPTGDQPQAINKIARGIRSRLKNQVLLGVTGSGKTFTIANTIQRLSVPTLVISHNKTLAGQLYQEMRDFFPHNAVSYFVSYYDYYQPEAYIPQSDTYIEKESQINDLIDKLRLQTTANVMTRNDVIVVASVSCIYNIGSPEEYRNFALPIRVGDRADWIELSKRLVQLLYDRSEYDFKRGTFRVRGNYMDIYPAYEDHGIRVMAGPRLIEGLIRFNPLTGKEYGGVRKDTIVLYPAKHYMADPARFDKVEKVIRHDLQKEHSKLKAGGKDIEAQRLLKKVNYDLEIIKEVGFVSGIENYSRYFDGRQPGDPPYSLLDYFKLAYGDNFLVCIDESHMTLSQIAGMYNGDRARKKTLIDYGFRMQAAFDNRPLTFDEFYNIPPSIVYISATPNQWEVDKSYQEIQYRKNSDPSFQQPHAGVVEQLVRPTGIVDPYIEVRPAKDEITDLISEIEERAPKREKILVTTLTKRVAEDLSEHLKDKQMRAAYLHSDIDTLERSDVLDNLRKNTFDVLIGVNLLREGLDLPEVTLVAILDADREGFLRSRTSLIQTMGRAARNASSTVILYADTITRSMQQAMDEIERRRTYQLAYNKRYNIKPKTVYKPIREKIIEAEVVVEDVVRDKKKVTKQSLSDIDESALTPYDRKRLIKRLEREMKEQAQQLNFELAIAMRDKIRTLRE